MHNTQTTQKDKTYLFQAWPPVERQNQPATTSVDTFILHESYTPAAISDEFDSLQCTLSRKIQYVTAESKDTIPMTFVTAFNVTASLPEALGSNVEHGGYILDCIADAMHLHHVAESVRAKYSKSADNSSEISVAFKSVIESLNIATRNLNHLLDVASKNPQEGEV